jgi:hypothetical protein
MMPPETGPEHLPPHFGVAVLVVECHYWSPENVLREVRFPNGFLCRDLLCENLPTFSTWNPR